MDLGVRIVGQRPDGSSVFLIGTYEHQERAQPKAGRGAASARDPVGRAVELASARSASRTRSPRTSRVSTSCSDRLLDLIVIAVLRAWFSLQEADAPAWYLGLGDPIVGRAADDAEQPGASVDRRRSSHQKSASRAALRDGSPRSSANRRCRCSRRGDSRSPQTSCATRRGLGTVASRGLRQRARSALRFKRFTESVPRPYRRRELACGWMSLIREGRGGVGRKGFEPLTPLRQCKCSPTELTARKWL